MAAGRRKMYEHEDNKRFMCSIFSSVVTFGVLVAQIVMVALPMHSGCRTGLKTWLVIAGIAALATDGLVLLADLDRRRKCAEAPRDRYFLVLGVLDAFGLVWFFIGTAMVIEMMTKEALYEDGCPLSFEIFWLIIWSLVAFSYLVRGVICLHKLCKGQSIVMLGGPGSHLWAPRDREIFGPV